MVIHKASGIGGVVIARILVQAQTGNTGHMYDVATIQGYRQRFEIELTAEDER